MAALLAEEPEIDDTEPKLTEDVAGAKQLVIRLALAVIPTAPTMLANRAISFIVGGVIVFMCA